MKNIILLLITISFQLQLFSQDWKPIRFKEVYNYYNDSTLNYHSVWADSTDFLNGDSIYYLNKIVEEKDTDLTYDHLAAIYNTNQPQFFLNELKYSPDGNVRMHAYNKNYFIKTKAKLNESWIFDSLNNISSTVVQKLQTTILGHTDSVKIIALNGIEAIIISKNYGIVQFPFKEDLSQNVKLVGIEKSKIGISIPTYLDFFDFEIGDVFYRQKKYPGRWVTTDILIRIEITDKNSTDSSYTYHARYFDRKINSDPNYGMNESDTTYSENLDSVFRYTNEKSSYLNIRPNEIIRYPGTGMYYKPVNCQWNSKFNTITKSYYSPTCYKVGSLILFYKDETSFKSENYGKNIGVVYNNSYENNGGWYASNVKEEKIIGYIRNGISYGTILGDSVFIDPAKIKSAIKLYPNPAYDFINLNVNNKPSPFDVQIIDVLGNTIFKTTLADSENTINLKNLHSGVYFLRIDNGLTTEIKRFIKI